MKRLAEFSSWVGKTFAVWAVIFAIIGFIVPSAFVGLKGLIVPALGIIMFGMGLTLTWKDFSEVGKRPGQVLLGVVAQFAIMPLVAWLLTKIFHLDPMLALGVVLVGCCPGGTSSNVITFLAKGDVALSVTITTISTLLAPLVTPLLLQVYAGSTIAVSTGTLMLAIAKMVLVPIVAGIVVHQLLGAKVQPAVAVLPLVSVVCIVVIISIVVALSQAKIAESGILIFGVVILHNLLGYTGGYLLGRAAGFSLPAQRAIMVEVGMQNSGLGAALAATYFNPVAALPSALFSVWHNISGALLANWCTWRDGMSAPIRR